MMEQCALQQVFAETPAHREWTIDANDGSKSSVPDWVAYQQAVSVWHLIQSAGWPIYKCILCIYTMA